MAKLSLTLWIHPAMQLPIKLDTGSEPMIVGQDITVVDLMDVTEEWFLSKTKELGEPLDLQINVLWNTKDHKKALNPNDKLSAHFVDGETFGVYGDVTPATDQPAPKTEAEKIPVTILTGFLGAGKTTMLNYILQEQREKKIAIIENEFGEISIDDVLLKQEKKALAERVIVMDNGCMCCTIRGDLAVGLKDIVSDVKAGGSVDMIMIETTGMADPVPIVRTFMSDRTLTCDLRLDAVITLADCKNLIARLDDDDLEEGKVNVAYQQIAFADKIILNKLDLISLDEAILVKDRIRAVNKYAKVIGAIKGRVRMTELVNICAHDIFSFVDKDIDKLGEVEELVAAGHGGHGGHAGGHSHDEDCTEGHGSGGHGGDGHDAGHSGHGGGHGDGHDAGHSGHGGGHGDGHDAGHSGHGGDHGGGHGDSHDSGHASGSHGVGHANGHAHGHSTMSKIPRHDSRVNSFAVVHEGEIHPRRLHKWMGMLGALPKERGLIFRIKAILAVKNHPKRHVFHAVMDVSDEDDAGMWAEGEKKICKIVFIGKGLDEPFLRQGFLDIFANP